MNFLNIDSDGNIQFADGKVSIGPDGELTANGISLDSSGALSWNGGSSQLNNDGSLSLGNAHSLFADGSARFATGAAQISADGTITARQFVVFGGDAALPGITAEASLPQGKKLHITKGIITAIS